MKAALVVVDVGTDRGANLRKVLAWTRRAAETGADLALFGEAVLTGLVNRDDPEHDLPLGEPVPGPATSAIGRAAREHGLHVGFGLLERDGERLFDTAVLLGPGGDILLHYRRIHPGWHGRRADGEVYVQGSTLERVDTDLGSFAFLLCGDLFDDEIVRAAGALDADWLLFPFWRCFEPPSNDDLRWQREEAEDYAKRVARTKTRTLMVNVLAPTTMEGGAFGGAFALADTGRLIDRLPLGQEGILVVDVP